MKCGYYWIINPPPDRLTDDGNRVPFVDVTIEFNGNEHKAVVFTNDVGRPELIKALLTGLPSKEIPGEFLPFLQSIKEHMLTALRLAYDENIALWDMSMWSFAEDDKTPTLNVAVKLPGRLVTPEAITNLFAQSLSHREQFRLYSNGVNEGIPAQYRFLSFYKLIEMQFRRRGKWNGGKLREFVQRFAADFRQKGITKDPISEMHTYRDKCAHIRSGKGPDSLGVSELNHKELVSLLRILPVMAKLGAEILRQLTNGNVVIQPVDRQDLWEAQAKAALEASESI
jgi:hypothetical protein